MQDLGISTWDFTYLISQLRGFRIDTLHPAVFISLVIATLCSIRLTLQGTRNRQEQQGKVRAKQQSQVWQNPCSETFTEVKSFVSSTHIHGLSSCMVKI
jgi:hypothetical protein